MLLCEINEEPADPHVATDHDDPLNVSLGGDIFSQLNAINAQIYKHIQWLNSKVDYRSQKPTHDVYQGMEKKDHPLTRAINERKKALIRKKKELDAKRLDTPGFVHNGVYVPVYIRIPKHTQYSSSTVMADKDIINPMFDTVAGQFWCGNPNDFPEWNNQYLINFFGVLTQLNDALRSIGLPECDKMFSAKVAFQPKTNFGFTNFVITGIDGHLIWHVHNNGNTKSNVLYIDDICYSYSWFKYAKNKEDLLRPLLKYK